MACSQQSNFKKKEIWKRELCEEIKQAKLMLQGQRENIKRTLDLETEREISLPMGEEFDKQQINKKKQTWEKELCEELKKAKLKLQGQRKNIKGSFFLETEREISMLMGEEFDEQQINKKKQIWKKELREDIEKAKSKKCF